MEHLGTDIQQALAGLEARLTPPDPPDAATMDPSSTTIPPTSSPDASADLEAEIQRYRRRYMLHLPTTETLRRDLERALELEARLAGARRVAFQRDVQHAQHRVEAGEERDLIQAARPAACRCLGLGGTRETAVLIFPSADGELAEIVPTWVDPCRSCAEGNAALDARTAALARRHASLIALELRRVFGDAALVDFREARLDNLRVDARNLESFRRLQAWLTALAAGGRLGMLLYGDVGAGKTYAMVAAMRHWIEHRAEPALFVTMPDLLQRIRDTYDASSPVSTAEVLRAARGAPLLILDDIGAEQLTGWGAEQVYGLLNERLNARLPTGLTSNHDLDELERRLGARIYSRVIGLCGGLEAGVCHWVGADRRR